MFYLCQPCGYSSLHVSDTLWEVGEELFGLVPLDLPVLGGNAPFEEKHLIWIYFLFTGSQLWTSGHHICGIIKEPWAILIYMPKVKTSLDFGDVPHYFIPEGKKREKC